LPLCREFREKIEQYSIFLVSFIMKQIALAPQFDHLAMDPNCS
jgi:hypothetical protein